MWCGIKKWHLRRCVFKRPSIKQRFLLATQLPNPFGVDNETALQPLPLMSSLRSNSTAFNFKEMSDDLLFTMVIT